MQSGKLLLAGLVVSGVIIGITSYAAERDPLAPRVPADQMAAAKAWKDPYESTPENIAKGKELFTGKATCFTCHGNEGRGDGPAGAALDPSPRNFHNPKFDQVKSPGEMLWLIKNGSAGTGMISYVPAIITEDEAAQIIVFERSLGNQP
jgi:mono/diheme cytochrome c family protein